MGLEPSIPMLHLGVWRKMSTCEAAPGLAGSGCWGRNSRGGGAVCREGADRAQREGWPLLLGGW